VVDFTRIFLTRQAVRAKVFLPELTLHFRKNPASGLYWTLAYSYSKSKFLALAGDIQPAAFDYRHQLTAIIGIKLKSLWSFSTRFKYADGRPYTPYDMELSSYFGRGIYDKTQYNKAKLPEYIRLDIRIDKHLNIGSTKMLAYIEVQNVLNRENIFTITGATVMICPS
jgi:hypothetical protein